MRIRARYAVIPLAAALVLTGCGRPGTAATIDGERLTDAELATLVEQYGVISGEPRTPGQMIFSLAQFGAVLSTAQEHGAGASPEEAVALLDANLEQKGADAFDYSDSLIVIAQGSVVLSNLQESDPELYTQVLEEATESFSAMDVTLNPRFGTWDATGEVLQDGTVMPALTEPSNPFLLTPGEDLAE